MAKTMSYPSIYMVQGPLLGPATTGTGTIALDPTFGSFILLEPI